MSKKTQWIVVGILFLIVVGWVAFSQGKELSDLNKEYESIASGDHYANAERAANAFINLVRNENYDLALAYCSSDIKESKLKTLVYPRTFKLERRTSESSTVFFWIKENDEVVNKIGLKFKDNEWKVSMVF